MSHILTACEVLDREFLAIRSKLIDLAAALDRIERAEGSVADDARLEKIRRSLGVLAAAAPDRAEQVQMIFSRAYEADWRKQFAV
jgi:hypothetical protein